MNVKPDTSNAKPLDDKLSRYVKPQEMPWDKARFPGCEMKTLLFDTAPNDPLTLIAVALMLALTSVVASWLPARRASRADPAIALRDG